MARVGADVGLIENHLSDAPSNCIGSLFILADVPHITAGLLDALPSTQESDGRWRRRRSREIAAWFDKVTGGTVP